MAQATDFEKKVYDWIDANVSLGNFTLKKGQMRDHWDGQIVSVHGPGGGQGRSLMTKDNSREKQPRVQVLVRAHKANRSGGYGTARTLYAELQDAQILGKTPWMGQDQPLPFNRDGDERHYFSINIRLLQVE